MDNESVMHCKGQICVVYVWCVCVCMRAYVYVYVFVFVRLTVCVCVCVCVCACVRVCFTPLLVKELESKIWTLRHTDIY